MKKAIILSFLFASITFSCSESGLFLSPDSFMKNGSYYAGEEESSGENYKEYEENPFILVEEQAVSTFSVDADGASYANMRRFVKKGWEIPSAAIRIEEFLNYFNFDYDEPTGNESVALNSELTTCPWKEGHYLLRLGMKGKRIPENELPNSNFVFLIDVSGSMSSDDKLDILKTGFKRMVDQLGQEDRVAIVTYAGADRVLLQSTSGAEKSAIKRAIDKLGASGSTAGAKGITTAYRIAEQHFIEGGNNRVILGSDGDFNVGPSSVEELVELIEEKKKSGIYFTVLGVGTGNLNDHMMEQIANKGNGNYEYIDNARQIEKVFLHDVGKFYTVATDSKIRLTFHPEKVKAYRLIGYENRSLNEEDFENDSTDAGEIGSGQAITALYQLQLHENPGSGAFADFDFRYKKEVDGQSRLLRHAIDADPVAIESASEHMRFSAALAAAGLLMKESQYMYEADRQLALSLAGDALGEDPHGYRQEFIDLLSDWD